MPHARVGALAVLVALLALPVAPADAEARRPSKRATKAALQLDRQIVSIIHERDRGDLSSAQAAIHALVAEHPDSMAAHLLYQEMAAVVRRNGPLVEAEYDHWLDQDPDDARRMVLHAAATLTAALTTPDYLDRDRIRAIERSLAAAEISDDAASYAHLIYAEVEQVRQRLDEVRDRLLSAVDADPLNMAARGELITAHAVLKEWDEAAAACIELLEMAPWRAPHCSAVIPERGERGGASEEDLNTIADLLEGLEVKHSGDAVVLQALYGLYDGVSNKPGLRRTKDALSKLGPWTAPLRRNPYLPPLPGGELTEEELASLERIQTIVEANEASPVNQAAALVAHEPELLDSPRIQAIYWRLRSHALRDEAVGDTDGSRASIKRASELQPEDAQLLNEWAYMSALDKVDLAEALAAVDRALEMLTGEPFVPLNIEPGESYGDWSAGAGESVGAFVDTRGWVLYQLGRYEEAVRELHLASTLTTDGTVQGHLGRARYAVGNDDGAFVHLLRALAFGCEDEDDVRKLASHIYGQTHVITGGLDKLVSEMHSQILDELSGGKPRSGGPESSRGPMSADELPSTFGSDSEHPLLGKPAPDMGVVRINGGGELRLDDLDGQVIVLDFWATWCGPCKKALPMYDALSRAFDGQPITFLLASVDDGMGLIESYWGDRDMPVQVGLVQDGGAESYDVTGIPSVFIIDKDGTVVGHSIGFEGDEQDALAATLAWLVSRGE
jgi:thiol-disulfide isomerase/thioredoxin/tetratricopeptide (TPR) repeat protein